MTSRTPRSEADILEELTPIFRRIFDDESLQITSGMTAKDVDGWDSLTHMSLIVAVEDRYKMRFKLADVVKFKNIGDMCRAVIAAGR